MRRKNKAQGSLFDLHVVTGIPEDTRPEVRVPVVIKFPAKPEGVVRVKWDLVLWIAPSVEDTLGSVQMGRGDVGSVGGGKV